MSQVRWEDVRETLNRKLGEGSSGQVWVASYFNSLIAVKVVRIDRTDGESCWVCSWGLRLCKI